MWLLRSQLCCKPDAVTTQALDLEVDDFFSFAPPPNDLGCVGMAAEEFLSRHKGRPIALVTVRAYISSSFVN